MKALTVVMALGALPLLATGVPAEAQQTAQEAQQAAQQAQQAELAALQRLQQAMAKSQQAIAKSQQAMAKIQQTGGVSSPRLMPVPPSMPAPDCKAPFWSYKGSDKTLCGMSVLYSSRQYQDTSQYRTAFRRGVLVGIDGVDLAAFDRPGSWTDIGSASGPSNLWWGRGPDGTTVAVGVESYGFVQRHASAQWPAMALSSPQAMTAHMLDLGKGKFLPFQKTEINYSQLAAPTGSVSGGFGGDLRRDGLVAPATVRNAQLTLQTLPRLQGVLQLDIEIYGKVRTFSIPLKRNAENDADAGTDPARQFRLRAGSIHKRGDEIVDCGVSRGQGRASCAYDRTGPYIDGQEYYDAAGVFFGPNSEYLAVKFVFVIAIPERHRTQVSAEGLVILRAKQ